MNDEKISNCNTIYSISTTAKALQMSRSRFYQCMEAGYFLKPKYTDDTNRPYFTAEMLQRNLEVKKTNVGVNGKICMFYIPRSMKFGSKQGTTSKSKLVTQDKYSDFIEGLKSLGLIDVTPKQVESAMQECFPNGVQNQEDGEVLKTIYLFIKRQNSEHKHRT